MISAQRRGRVLLGNGKIDQSMSIVRRGMVRRSSGRAEYGEAVSGRGKAR